MNKQARDPWALSRWSPGYYLQKHLMKTTPLPAGKSQWLDTPLPGLSEEVFPAVKQVAESLGQDPAAVEGMTGDELRTLIGKVGFDPATASKLEDTVAQVSDFVSYSSTVVTAFEPLSPPQA